MSSFTVPEAPARTILPAAAVLASLVFFSVSVASGFSSPGRRRRRRADHARGVDPPGVHRLAATARKPDPRHPLHSDPPLLAARKPAVRARAVSPSHHAAARRLGCVAARRSPCAVPAHRLRGPAAGDLRLDRGLDHRQPGSRCRALVPGAEGPDVLHQLRARPLHDDQRDQAARQHRLPRDDARGRWRRRRVLLDHRGSHRDQRLQPPRPGHSVSPAGRGGRARGVPEVRLRQASGLRLRAAPDRAQRGLRDAVAARPLPGEALRSAPLVALPHSAHRRLRLDRFPHRDHDVRRSWRPSSSGSGRRRHGRCGRR